MNAEERLARAYVAGHPDDAARLLERAAPADAAAFLASMPPAEAAAVYRALGPPTAAACAAALPDDAIGAIVDALPLDVAGVALRLVEPARRPAVIDRLAEDKRGPLRAILGFPDNSAGALADPLVLALPEDITVADAQKQMRGTGHRVYYYLYVVSRDHVLTGTLAMPELMGARPSQTLSAVMQRALVRVDAHTDLATLAAHPAWRDFDALPVVDGAGRLVGAIRHKVMRQMSGDAARPMMSTIVGLSELYWMGLSGMLASLVPAQAEPRAEEDQDVP